MTDSPSCYHRPMVGARIREARQARQLSLNTVAQKADISVATLSRIERDQQRIDVELLLTLMRILKINAQDVLDEQKPEDGVDPIVAKISALAPPERTKLWRDLTANRKGSRVEPDGPIPTHEVRTLAELANLLCV